MYTVVRALLSPVGAGVASALCAVLADGLGIRLKLAERGFV